MAVSREIEQGNARSDANDHHEHKESELNAIRFKSLALAFFSSPLAAAALFAWASLAAPGVSLATSITFPNPTVQVPWASGNTAFGHIKSKTGPLDALASGPSQFPSQAQVWLNDGHGNFTAGDLLTGSGNSFTLADMNNDGYDDAILVWSGGLIIWLNNGTGDGSFNTSPNVYPYGTPGYFPSGEDFQPTWLAAARTKPGGNVNVIVTGRGSYGVGHVRLFSGNGDGTLAANPVDLATGFYPYGAPSLKFADVNNNGAPAIVVPAAEGNAVEVFGNDGSGNFSRTFTLPATVPHEYQAGVEFIDMDHDGTLDMVVLALDYVNNNTTTVSWYKGLGRSTFDPTPHTAWAGGQVPGQNWIFQTQQWSPGGYFITHAADFDGDGQVDLAMSAQLTQPIILRNNGDGTFSPAWAAPLTDSNGLPAFALFMSYVDVTGTGQKSLIGSNYTNNSSQVYTPYGEFYGSPSTTPPDTTPPVITVPGNITAEATGSAGASVTFSASATDAVDGPVPVTCVPASGSTFPLGMTPVNCSASDAHHNTATASFKVTVVDTTPPVITVPGNLTAEATGPGGAVVTYTASATDLVDGSVPVTCTPLSGATFALGPTPVSCSATDAHGNRASGNFSVTVRDTTPPVVTASLVAVRGGGDDESMQSFRVVFSATDAVGVTTLSANLNGITVTNGQIVQLKVIKAGAQKAKREDGRLQIRATSFTLTVTAADAAGNTRSATAVPVFVKNGKDDDRDKG